MEHYLKTGVITNKLMMEASSCKFYALEARNGFNDLRKEYREHYQANKDTLIQIANDVEEIGAKEREFEEKHWLNKLQNYYRKSDGRGHSSETEHYKALLWGCAGRVLLTIDDKHSDATITLIFDETSKEARGGIQNICATKDQAMKLLQAAIDNFPAMKTDDKVRLAGF